MRTDPPPSFIKTKLVTTDSAHVLLETTWISSQSPAMANPTPNGWLRAYAEAPEVLHGFAAAEDPDGLVMRALIQKAGLADPNEAKTSAHIPQQEPRLLEIGCGTNPISRRLPDAKWAKNCIGLDSSAVVLQHAQQFPLWQRLLQAKAEQLPFPDQTFDLIFASWVLSYLRPRSLFQCLQECKRTLASGGSIWAIENAEAGADGMPMDGNIPALLDCGFEMVQEIQTELRFPNAQTARSITRYLMGVDAPKPDARGRIPHRVSLLQLCIE
jgi:hypothetical protein